MTTELVFRDDAYLRECAAVVTAVDERGIQLDRTVFYARGGGQPGDIGRLTTAGGMVIEIADAVKGDGPDDVLHIPAEGAATPNVGDDVTAAIDWDRRYRLMRMHSCLHLLSAVIPGAVTGGQVAPDKGRLDFDWPEGGLDKETVTSAINDLIAADHAVTPRWVTDDELAANPELVKTMSVAPPRGAGRVRLIEVAGTDLQACGGTHVKQTGEIGRVRVRKIESKGKQNRRVTVVFDE